MSSFDELKDRLHTSDHQLWLLIGLCVALLATMEAVQEAVEGAWPHQRRVTRMDLGEQRAHPSGPLVALLILPAALLAVGNRRHDGLEGCAPDRRDDDRRRTAGDRLGPVPAGERRCLRLRPLIARAGPVFPIALVVVLAAAIALLLSAFLDVRPSVDTLRDAIPLLSGREIDRLASAIALPCSMR